MQRKSHLPELLVGSCVTGLGLMGWAYYDLTAIGEQFPWGICLCMALWPTLALAAVSLLFWLRHLDLRGSFLPVAANLLIVGAFFAYTQFKAQYDYFFLSHVDEYNAVAAAILSGALTAEPSATDCGLVALPTEYAGLSNRGRAELCRLRNGTTMVLFEYDSEDGILWGYLYTTAELLPKDQVRCSTLRELRPAQANWQYCNTDARFQQPDTFLEP